MPVKCNTCVLDKLKNNPIKDSVYPICGEKLLHIAPCYWLKWLQDLEIEKDAAFDKEEIINLIQEKLKE